METILMSESGPVNAAKSLEVLQHALVGGVRYRGVVHYPHGDRLRSESDAPVSAHSISQESDFPMYDSTPDVLHGKCCMQYMQSMLSLRPL